MKQPSILLVDGNREFLKSAEQFLRSQTQLQIVGCASSGQSAIQQTRELSPDCVLIDLVMPGMNGIEATQKIKSQPSPPKVIIQTVHDNPAYRSASEKAGADGFIVKSSFFHRSSQLSSRYSKQRRNLVRRGAPWRERPF
ncbi:MAG: response regulator transcription factor [Acidobacteriota bacterium]